MLEDRSGLHGQVAAKPAISYFVGKPQRGLHVLQGWGGAMALVSAC